MKVFLVGDYRTGTGPANVTLEYKKRLPDVLVQKMRSKFFRVPELAAKIFRCDVVLLSGHSRQNLLSIRIAHAMHKKVAFLMHGCVEHENQINGVPDADMTRVERQTLAGSDAIYAVSEHFAAWLKEHYPEYASKISAVPNGIGQVSTEEDTQDHKRKQHAVLSIGGGMPRKRIRYIAKAIMLLREDPAFSDTYLTVIGDRGPDTEKIDAYPCVKNRGLVSYDRAMELLEESALFVQNSCFETFGLAPMEALMMGASVLLSTQVGATELFTSTEEGDLIRNTEDAKEIADKIRALLLTPNRNRLLQAIDTESASWDNRCSLLMQKLQELTQTKE